MRGRSLYWFVLVGAIVSLSACVSLPGAWKGRPLSYNVRTASVLANGDVPLDLLAAVDRRVSSAIATTRPPDGAERVVLLIRFDRVDKGLNARRRLDRAHVTVTASSVETGEPVAEAKFVINAATDDPRFARESLAEQIAARIRFAFSLTTPSLRSTRPKPRISTVLKSEQPDFGATDVGSNVTPKAPDRRPEPSMGATVDEGARGTVRLGADCDAVTNPNCLSARP